MKKKTLVLAMAVLFFFNLGAALAADPVDVEARAKYLADMFQDKLPMKLDRTNLYLVGVNALGGTVSMYCVVASDGGKLDHVARNNTEVYKTYLRNFFYDADIADLQRNPKLQEWVKQGLRFSFMYIHELDDVGVICSYYLTKKDL